MGHKRKKSLQDTVVDLNKITHAIEQLSALTDELDNIEETEDDMLIIKEHINKLKKILAITETAVRISPLTICIQNAPSQHPRNWTSHPWKSGISNPLA